MTAFEMARDDGRTLAGYILCEPAMLCVRAAANEQNRESAPIFARCTTWQIRLKPHWRLRPIDGARHRSIDGASHPHIGGGKKALHRRAALLVRGMVATFPRRPAGALT